MKVTPLREHAQSDVQMDDAENVRMRMLVGPSEGAKTFHMRHFEIQPGGHTPHHRHDYEHELLILRGQGTARSEGGDRPFRCGDVIWVPPNETHQFRNTGNEPLEFICLIPAACDCST